MKFQNAALIMLSVSSSITAFTARIPNKMNTINKKLDAVLVSDDGVPSSGNYPDKPIYDPMGLYSKNSFERQQGLIVPEAEEERSIRGVGNKMSNIVTDPLNLYSDKSEVTTDADMSASLPFLPRPEALDGTLPGDRGFDPLNLASRSISFNGDIDDDDNDDGASSTLKFYRTSELKHARLAMLAAVGWPVAELFHNKIASIYGEESILNLRHQVPSVLNGGLDKVSPIFWASALAFASIIEICSGALNESDIQSSDLGFDPLGLGGRRKNNNDDDEVVDDVHDRHSFFMAESELLNGRLAMLAVTGFAIQEWLTQNSVVDAVFNFSLN